MHDHPKFGDTKCPIAVNAVRLFGPVFSVNLGAILFLALAASATAMTLYVDCNSTNATPPYTNQATAAATIQDAVDAATAGDTVLVNDCIYASGGRTVGTNVLVNRVVVDKPVTLQSVNGPLVTIIQGAGPIGANAVRCVYLTNGAALIGFTLTMGATGTNQNLISGDSAGAGVWCASPSAVLSNCVMSANAAYGDGGGGYRGTWNNCTLSSNSASGGGGAYSATLNNCTLIGNSVRTGGGGTSQSKLNNCILIGNSANDGGGNWAGTLTNCTLTGNWAKNGGASGAGTLVGCTISNNWAEIGGGTYFGTLINCMFSSNSANWGGGMYESKLSNCTLVGNVATWSTIYNNGGYGGGAYRGRLDNCTLVGNVALRNSDIFNHNSLGGGACWSVLNNCALKSNSATYGGGAYSATLTSCTLTGNTAVDGGGAAFGTLTGCIVYYNTAAFSADYAAATLNYCCTTSLPSDGTGNFNTPPLFVDLAGGNLHLQSNSPCINAGKVGVSGSTDLDGNPRIIGGTVDVGAYEFQNSTSLISYQWLQLHMLPTDGSADFTDLDADGMNNYQEWRARTNPTNSLSVLKMLAPSRSSLGTTAQWQSVSGVTYFLQRATNLSMQPAFASVRSNIIGQAGTTIYADTNAIGAGPVFYRVGMQ